LNIHFHYDKVETGGNIWNLNHIEILCTKWLNSPQADKSESYRMRDEQKGSGIRCELIATAMLSLCQKSITSYLCAIDGENTT